MATKTDDFERATLGGDWTNGPSSWNDMTIVNSSEAEVGTNATDCMCYWSESTWDDDHTSEITIHSPANFDFIGAIVRAADRNDCYDAAHRSTTEISVFYIDSSKSFTLLGSQFTVSTMSTGDKIRLEVVGSTLELFLNNVSQGTRSDSNISSGSAGIAGFRNTGEIEDWTGTGASDGTPTFKPRMVTY